MVEDDNGKLGQLEDDRRRSTRYDIRLPAQLTVDYSGRARVSPATTKDVSDEGAFLVTDLTLPTGSKIVLELRLELDSLLELIGRSHSVSVKTEGTVVRNEHHGMAVSFGRKVSFRPYNPGEDYGHNG
jgi:hypothetical protein